MRILLISDHADPLEKPGSKEAGGQNVYVLNLANFLSKKGIKVDVYTRWDQATKNEVVSVLPDFRVIRVKAGPKAYMPRDSFINVVEEFTANVNARIAKEGLVYDIIHSNYWFSGIIGLKLAKLLNLPQVHVYHSLGQNRFNALKDFRSQQVNYVFYQTRLLWEKQIAKQVDGIITTSPIEQQEICKLFNIPIDKTVSIPIGVDTQVFKPMPKLRARKKLGMRPEGPILLYVGRIEWRKGIGTLISAMTLLDPRWRKSRLYIVGGGRSAAAKKMDQDECSRLHEMVEELKLDEQVFFLGPKNPGEIAPYYSAADVCVVPSYYEPFGIVPIEAMACGTPVVASRIGGLQYTVVDNLTGKLFKPKDAEDLASNLNEVLTKGKSFYGADARKNVVERFNWSKVIDTTIAYLYTVTKSKELKTK